MAKRHNVFVLRLLQKSTFVSDNISVKNDLLNPNPKVQHNHRKLVVDLRRLPAPRS